ncbi:MAG: methylenetetrahydrofolate--tRNA-(uracil(54)-C(5))-methyltransferase (FADH(2)-oxidizing) TrmFO [Bdellovibrionota bacterium]
MKKANQTIHIVGGGLAGSECALQLANFGFKVVLFEMRQGNIMTPAHKTKDFAELVCSNSFGTLNPVSCPGELKAEAELLGSYILKAAKLAAVPAGQALGVDRAVFAQEISKQIENHPNIEVRKEVVEKLSDIPRPAVIATGPLTNENLARDLLEHLGQKFLYFFDAIAPIVDADTIDTTFAWKADRYGKGNNDYYNCPMNKEEYYAFINEIKLAKKIEPKEFEKDTPYFDGCMPIEEMIRRGDETLRFGPLKPVGLDDPRTGRYPYAVVQLRQDNLEGTAFNMVGFQTKLAYGEQQRIFKMIPGLQNAEFLKLGSIHRNMYVNSPEVLNQDLSSKKDPDLYLAGQITGVEGYFESTCIGMLVANFIEQKYSDKPFNPPPRESAMGALLHAITLEKKENFQPTNINFGLLPALPVPKGRKIPKDIKKKKQIENAQVAFNAWLNKSLPTHL